MSDLEELLRDACRISDMGVAVWFNPALHYKDAPYFVEARDNDGELCGPQGQGASFEEAARDLLAKLDRMGRK